MPVLIIPDIDEETARRLQRRADRSGRSLADEARGLIAAELSKDPAASALAESPGESAWDVLQRIRAKAGGGVDFEPLDRKEWKDRPVDFGE